jgi:hypothetical protein
LLNPKDDLPENLTFEPMVIRFPLVGRHLGCCKKAFHEERGSQIVSTENFKLIAQTEVARASLPIDIAINVIGQGGCMPIPMQWINLSVFSQ